MPASPSKIAAALLRYLLQFTLYDMMLSSHDFEDVRSALNERVNWTIEMLRSAFNIRLANGGYFITLCTLFFLAAAESMHMHYGRLTPAQLKERVETMGYATFAIINAIPDLGALIIRAAEIITVSGSPGLAFVIVLFSAIPGIIIPVLLHLVDTFRTKAHKPTAEQEVAEGTVV
ncbi:hypothetical protein HYDPIDRAFT_108218 [Hydnomerulius pinastri MD-312]|nr:hypothetical protein HYDPIDRAFT_108218 [Hydnomerulius pinastri MD-312]